MRRWSWIRCEADGCERRLGVRFETERWIYRFTWWYAWSGDRRLCLRSNRAPGGS